MKENHTGKVGDVHAVDNDGHRVTGYRLSGPDARHFHNAFGRLLFKQPPNYESPRDAGRDNVYNVTMTATSGTGSNRESASQDVTVTVTDVDVPGRVASAPTFTAWHGSVLSFEWSPPGTDGGDHILRYDLRYDPPGPGLNNRGSTAERYSTVRHAVPEQDRDRTTFRNSLTRLDPSETYTVWVRAVNSEGAGPWSPPASRPTLATPLAPRPQVEGAGETAVRISWNAPRDQGSAVTQYQVLWGLTSPSTARWRAP